MKRLKAASVMTLCAVCTVMFGAWRAVSTQADPVIWRADRSVFVSAGGNMYDPAWLSLTLLAVAAAFILMGILAQENNCNSYFRVLFQNVVQSTNVGVAIKNGKGEYEYMNKGYRNILFIRDANPLLKTSVDLMSGATAAVLGSIANSGAGRTAGQFRVGAPNGSESGRTEPNAAESVSSEQMIHSGDRCDDRYIEYEHFTVYDRDQQEKHVDVLNDVSDIEQMKQKLEEQLKEIQYYSNIKDIFLANISHEIKTPLNAIVGTTYFLKDTPLSPKQQDLVGKIEHASDMLVALVNDVLDFSKLKEKKIDLYDTAFLLTEVIGSVEELFLPQLEKKGLRWECDLDFDLELCICLDRIRLIQVLSNIIGNACKFTDEGYIRLAVETVSENDESVELEFCVEDSGIGIAEEDFPKLFNEFEQLENHLTKQHTGTGLGLAISKYIVEDMGGRIWVKSELGAGSCFYFSLTAPKASAQDAVCGSGSAENCSRPDGRGTRVLVVEDTEINREITVNLLKAVHAEYDVAENGLEAIQCCERHGKDYYDVILMDIHMPKMDGYTASSLLKKELQIETPIIALTATEADDEIRTRYKDTISGFILKPFQIEDFYSTLGHYFVSNRQKPEGTAAVLRTASDPFAGKEEAIHNMGGDEAMYYKHAAKFQENNRNTMEELLRLLRQGDEKEAHRCVHSVKGTAGMLGMTNLHTKAAFLADILAQGKQEKRDEAVKDFGEALAEVLRTRL